MARHHLGGTAPDVETAIRGVVAMHASDPSTPFLGVRARLAEPASAVEDLERALYEDRTLWRMHAVRRTLFVATIEDAVLLQAGAGHEIARRERRRLLGWLGPEVGEVHAATWLAGVEARVLDVLSDGQPRRTAELTAAVPALATEVTLGSGRWSQRSRVASHVLFVLAMDARVVRGRPAGTWRGSQFTWTAASRWFPRRPSLIDDEATGRAALLRRYLERHGPATRTDVRWWTGWTVAQTAAALDACGAVGVELGDGSDAYVLPDDLGLDEPNPHHVALLPGLDPTPMGWKERDWYLGPHADRLFDRNGNVGPTVWVDGRVVGGWGVRDGGDVVHHLLEDVGSDAHVRVEAAAAEVRAWLGGDRVTPRFRTPLEKELTA